MDRPDHSLLTLLGRRLRMGLAAGSLLAVALCLASLALLLADPGEGAGLAARLVLLALALAGLALPFAAWRILSHPHPALAETASRVARGDLTVRIPVQHGMPGRELAEGFNAMLEGLAGRVGRLEARLAEQEASLAGARRRLEAEAVERRRLEGESRAAAAELEAGRRLKGEFLASVSHDVRTPLNGILGMLHLLGGTGLTEVQAEYAQGARDAALELLSILNDVLDLSRIRAGRLSLVPAPFCPADMAEQLRVRTETRAKAKGLRFSFHSGLPAGERLLGDAERLCRVLGALLDAALKTSDGQDLVLEADRLPVWLPDGSPAARLIFAVGDGGPGLAPDQLPEFHHPADQGNVPTPGRMGGLGLALARRLAGLMGAEVCLAAEPELGSEAVFSLVLPLARPEEGSPILTPRRARAPAPAPGARILVAEDDPVAQLAIIRILAAEGYGALGVANGLEVLAALARERFDVVLMDIQMPVMNGVEATSAIRSGSRGVLDRNVPIIALTAYALAGDRETFLAAGMDDYLTKPVVLENLEAAIRRALARREGTGPGGT